MRNTQLLIIFRVFGVMSVCFQIENYGTRSDKAKNDLKYNMGVKYGVFKIDEFSFYIISTLFFNNYGI